MKTAVEPPSHDSRSSAPAVSNGSRVPEIVPTDGELLMRFRRHRDRQAFAQIVERHGGLVWLVCRQVLRHHQDTEDAFQATFLILAQRAGTIRASDSAAAWLYGVAQRTALAARRKRARRREENLAIEPPVGEEALRVIHDREMLRVLVEELRALPERYQTPLLLRYFEGQSRRMIAEQTDSTVAQIQGRLVRGRRLLRSRLVRRGVSLSLAAGAVSSVSATASAAVTPTLIAGTATSCLTFTTSGTATGTSPAALELANQGVKAMWYASITKFAAVASTVLVTAGAIWAAQQGGGDVKISAAANGLELQAAPPMAAEIDEGATVVFAAAADRKDDERAAREEQLQKRNELARTIRKLRSELDQETQARAEIIAAFEQEEMEKALLQRDLEQLREMLIRLKLPERVPLDEEPKERQRDREELIAGVLDQIAETKKQLWRPLINAAKASTELEIFELERITLQRRLEELQRLLTQFDYFPQEGESAIQAAPTRLPFDEPPQADVTRQLDELRREIQDLRAQNTELQKQLDQLTQATEPPPRRRGSQVPVR